MFSLVAKNEVAILGGVMIIAKVEMWFVLIWRLVWRANHWLSEHAVNPIVTQNDVVADWCAPSERECFC